MTPLVNRNCPILLTPNVLSQYVKNYEQPNQCNGNNLITTSLFRNAIKSQGGLKLIHFNARIQKGVDSCKIDQLRILLDDKFIFILAVSQTWFNSTILDDEVRITGDFNYNYVLDETLPKNPAHLIDPILNCS